MSVVARYWMLASVLVSVDAALAAQNMRFASIVAEDKLMIVDSVCDRIAKQDHDCVHMVCASDGVLYKKWRAIPYDNDTFVIMKEFSLCPAMVKWLLPGVASFRRSILSGDEPLFVYLNEAPMQVLAENRLHNILAGRYFPILCPMVCLLWHSLGGRGSHFIISRFLRCFIQSWRLITNQMLHAVIYGKRRYVQSCRIAHSM